MHCKTRYFFGECGYGNGKSKEKKEGHGLPPKDSERLKSINAAVNELFTYKKISETMIVKALLYNGKKMRSETLIKAIKEVIL